MSLPLPDAFRAARRDPELVVLEGFHALKHALRFGGDVLQIVAARSADLDGLAGRLAPELAPVLARVELVDEARLAQLVPRAPRTGIVALARRPAVDVDQLLAGGRGAPVVALECPRTMGNLGAVVRVAAAADAAAVLTTGPHDPWHPDAVRGAAGLHFALPVARLTADEAPRASAGVLTETSRRTGRPLLALDPDGGPLRPAAIPPGAILVFGTERDGLSPELLHAADERLALPMRPGVSSMNLATSVAATLYALRLVSS